MKLHTNTAAGLNTITAYGEGYVSVNGRRLEQSFLLTSTDLIENWDISVVTSLTTEALDKIGTFNCDIVVLGTGKAQVFPPREVLRSLQERRIGVEIMDSFAACRTYNILVMEGRSVALAVIMEDAA
jgi:uncharacterized protein